MTTKEREFGDSVQVAECTQEENHILVIECPDQVKADEVFEVNLSLGKGIGHPNTTEHHILWISLYFHAEGDQFIKDVGRLLLNTHGESVLGPNQGPVYAYPAVTMLLKINKSGMLYAVTYCNIHGLLESEKEIRVG